MERVRKKEYKTQTMNKTQNNNIYIPQTDTETLGEGVIGINKRIKRTHNS